MNQIVHPLPAGFNNGPAPSAYYYPPQGSPYRGDTQESDQAFAYPSQQQRPYQDGVQGGMGPSSMPAPGGSIMMQPGTRPAYSQAQAPVSHKTQARQSASPQKRLSPAASQASRRTPPSTHPMAAPPLPQSPAYQHQQSHFSATNNVAPAGSPSIQKSPIHDSSSTPQLTNREQKRVALLLSINNDLLTEVQRLQAAGQGGAMNPQQADALRKTDQPVKMASEEYIQCLRRVQANLAYLMARAQPAEGKAPPAGPAHMTPPPHVPGLAEKYAELRELFPGWQGLDHRLSRSGSMGTGSPRVVQGQQNHGATMAQAQAS